MNSIVSANLSRAAEKLPIAGIESVDSIFHWISGDMFGILIAVGIGVAIAVVLLALRAWGHRLISVEGESLFWRMAIGRVLAKTSLFFIVMCSAELVAENAGTPPGLLRAIHFLFVVAAALQMAVWARELILCLVGHRIGEHEEGTLGSAMGLIKVLVTVALFAIAFVVILDNLGVNVTGLVAGLGIGGIAIGLAAQGIFADLFAALSIIFDKPFRRGDSIRWDATSGTVERIGLKSTRVRALTGEQVVISNTNLLGKELHNMARLDRRRIVQTFGIIYQTPPEVCALIPAMVAEIVAGCENCHLVRCGMTNLGASSLDYELQFDVHSEDYDVVFQARAQVLIAILHRFNAEGIEFAYPTQTTFTAAPDGTLVMPYPQVQPVLRVDKGSGEE